MKAAVAAAALLFASSVCANANPLSRSQIRRVDAVAAKALAAQHISGLEIGIGRRGAVVFSQGYGLRDRLHRRPVTAQTVFPIGSITKQFTAACVMQLVARGKVRLDAHVSQYVPDAPHGNQVTVRELLDQTSGLPDYLEDKALLGTIMNGTVGPGSVASMVALVAGKPLHFSPGTKYEYSNTNYALAGMLVGKIGNTTYPQYLQHNIFVPQGMARTQYLRYSVPAGTDATRGYDFKKGTFRLLPPFSMDWGNAAGAIASDASDLIRWDHAFFSGSVIPLNLVRVATSQPAGIVMTPSRNRVNNIGLGYAFGWVQARTEGRQMIWHNGGLPGARAMNATFPRDGLDIIVLTNASSAQPEDIALQIARIIYDTP
ncbi:MAG: serine hydrolase domain-containing protein [Candidatus Baltobacteraceae bacterium]